MPKGEPEKGKKYISILFLAILVKYTTVTNGLLGSRNNTIRKIGNSENLNSNLFWKYV